MGEPKLELVRGGLSGTEEIPQLLPWQSAVIERVARLENRTSDEIIRRLIRARGNFKNDPAFGERVVTEIKAELLRRARHN
jgi:hypothetical protein